MKMKKQENRTIGYLPQEEKVRSRALYEEMFYEDPPAYVDAYYKIKGADNRILALEENGEMLSMLHLNPYRFWLRGDLVESSYIVAVATSPKVRHQGCMSRLIYRAMQDLYEEKQPFAFLMPASEAIYTPFDFRRMENEGKKELSSASMEELKQKYDLFVWKDERYFQRNMPEDGWETTPMMMRIVNLREMVRHIGLKNLTMQETQMTLRIRITDPILSENAGDYIWRFQKDGSELVSIKENRSAGLQAAELSETDVFEPELIVSIADLGSFLFGAKGKEGLFPQASLRVLQKLEKIHVLGKIFINEVV